MKDYYSILGISSTAADQDIKKAYRSLVKKWHPDVNKSPGAQSKFIEITEAYEMLMNPTTRQQYDTMKNRGYESYDNTNHGSQDSTESDFSRARESARQRGKEYSSISIDELFREIFESAMYVGKATIVGEKEYTDSITLGDKLKLGLKGWFSVVLLLLTFTGILAPVTIPILLKVLLVSKGKIVGLIPILAGMVLYIPFFIMFVLFVGYSLDILYIHESQYLTYMGILAIIAAVTLTMAYKTSYKSNQEFRGASSHKGLEKMVISKKIPVASIFLMLYLVAHWLGTSLDMDSMFRLKRAIIFVAGVVLGPLFGLITGFIGHVILNLDFDYFIFSFYVSDALRVSLFGFIGGLITLDKTFDLANGEVSQRNLKKIFLFILLGVSLDIAILYVTYQIIYYGYWSINSKVLTFMFKDVLYLSIVGLSVISMIGKWRKKKSNTY